MGEGGAANRVYYQLGDSKIENILIEVYLWCYDIPKFVSTACRTKVMKSVFSQHFLFLRNTCRKFRSLSRRLGASTSLHWGSDLHSLRCNLLKIFFLIIERKLYDNVEGKDELD